MRFFYKLVPALLMVVVMTGHAFASDTEGNFSIRGAGLLTCANLVAEREEQTRAYLMIGGWLDGYLTGMNQYASDTYDNSSFESTELFLAIMDKHCKDNPRDRLFSVVNTIMTRLHPDRIRKGSPLIPVQLGEYKTQLYQETIQRIQHALTERGHFKGKPTRKWDEHTERALTAFQAGAKLEPSGFLDQTTLWRLLRKEEKNP